MSNVIKVDFGKRDEGKLVYILEISWEPPAWWVRLFDRKATTGGNDD